MTEDWKGATLQMLVFFWNADYAFQFIYGIAKLHDKTDVFGRGKANFCDSPRIYNFFFIENFWKDLPLQKMSTHNPFVYDLLVSKRSVDIHFIVVLFWFIFINFSLVNDYYSKFVISDQILT